MNNYTQKDIDDIKNNPFCNLLAGLLGVDINNVVKEAEKELKASDKQENNCDSEHRVFPLSPKNIEIIVKSLSDYDKFLDAGNIKASNVLTDFRLTFEIILRHYLGHTCTDYILNLASHGNSFITDAIMEHLTRLYNE